MKQKKNENRKIIIKFVLILLASMVLGALSSILMASMTQGRLVKFDGLERAIGAAVPYVLAFANLIAAITAIVLCGRSKKEIDAWDGEDECIEQTEQRLSYSLLLANLMMVVNFLLFSASIWAAEHTGLEDRSEVAVMMASLAVFVLGMVWIMCISYRVVKLEQQINPEKRGNILDTKFHKQWMASCDEAETQLIYQSGFQAYRAGHTACMVLWVVALLAQLWAGTGVFPVLCICIIWLALTMGYVLTSIRLERHK